MKFRFTMVCFSFLLTEGVLFRVRKIEGLRRGRAVCGFRTSVVGHMCIRLLPMSGFGVTYSLDCSSFFGVTL